MIHDHRSPSVAAPAAPCPLARPRAAKGRVALLVALASGLGLAASGPIRGQVALEAQAGAVRIWRPDAAPLRLGLDADLAASSAVEAEDGLIVAGRNRTSGRLFVAHWDGTAMTLLPTPRSRGGERQFRPVLLADAGRLESVTWLEGSSPQDAAIRTAAWNGTSWESTETVSARRGRAQLAVSGAVLEDGTRILVWAGYDGRDDEIFFSRRLDDGWSPPARLHENNSVPDLLPAVSAADGGAIAAWSSYDGNDYRLRTAVWTESGWKIGPTLAGRGAHRATFQQAGERRFLTYRSIEPEAWVLAEIDVEGRPRRRAVVESAFDEPPLVTATGSARPGLAWPWRPRGTR